MAPYRSISDVVDDLGFGAAQIRLLTLGGGIYWLIGTETTLLQTLPQAISLELDLHPYQRALLVSTGLLGLLIGNYANALSDTHIGRRKPILVGYALVLSSVFTSSLVYSHWLLALCWLITGLGLGLGGPSWNSLAVECSPTSKRTIMHGCMYMWYAISALSVLLVERTYSDNLHFGAEWRSLVRWMQVPCFLLFIAAVCIGFVDSPHVQLAQGSPVEARRTLEIMSRQNGRTDVSLDFHISELSDSQPSVSVNWNLLFSKQLFNTTMVVCVMTFVLNFVGFGAAYSLPIMLSSIEGLGVSPAQLLCFGPVTEMLGYAVGMWGSKVASRRFMMISSLNAVLIANMVLCVVLYRVNDLREDFYGQVCLVMMAGSMQFIMAPLWLVVYVYVPEVFPTKCRGLASGFVMGCGRVGSIVAPLVFEHLHLTTGSHVTFFFLICVVTALTSVLVFLVLPETKDCPLDTVLSGEQMPLKGGSDFPVGMSTPRAVSCSPSGKTR